MRSEASGTNRRRYATLLAVLALGLRILIPSGWMPAADRIGLMPCFGTAAPMASTTRMAHHAASRREGHDKSDQGDKTCAFVGFAGLLAEPDAPASAPALLVTQSLPPIFAAPATVGAGLAAPPPPPTGPPINT